MDLATPLEERSHLDQSFLKPAAPLPSFLVAHPASSKLTSSVEHQLEGTGSLRQSTSHEDDPSVILQDVQDDFVLRRVDAMKDLSAFIQKRRRQPVAPSPSGRTSHEIIVASTSTKPEWTPLFDLHAYWQDLDSERKRIGRQTQPSDGETAPRVGDLLLYSEAIASTQTMLDRSIALLYSIPTPFLSVASFQLSGRGRGSNSWISPPGCLQFSLALSLPEGFPASKIVFVQYLFALAVCEALDDNGKLGVRIKWPNDIYAEAEGLGEAQGTIGKGKVKIGGILITTSFHKGQWKVIVGTGINVLNSAPTTSLSKLHQMACERYARSGRTDLSDLGPKPTMEGSLAKMLVAFEQLWDRFLEAKGFEPFLDEYLGRWLHNDQIVTLTTTTPHERLKIKSITLDHGLLRCVKLDSGRTPGDYGGEDRTSFWVGQGLGSKRTAEEYVDLQPDGNSFDLMSGMIKKKL